MKTRCFNFSSLQWRHIIFGIFLAFFTSIIIVSCKKSFHPVNNLSTNYVDGSSLKLWFDQNGTEIKRESNWLNTLLPNWQKAQLFDTDLESVYEIDLDNPERIFAAASDVDLKNIKTFENKSLLKLIIFENKLNKKYNAVIIEVVAFEDNDIQLAQLHYKSYKTFTGAVNFYELNGQLSNGWLYREGEIIATTDRSRVLSKISVNENNLATKGKVMLAAADPIECGSRSVPHWRQNCITIGGLDGWGYDGGGGTTTCTWEAYHTTEIIYCPNLGDGGGGGSSGGGYTGGGGGGGGTPSKPPANDPDCAKKTSIQNRATDPTIKSQTDQIRQNSTINEYGAEQNLTSLTGTPGYKDIPVRTDGMTHDFVFNATWNPTAGYAIGFNHGHPSGSAQSPADIFIPAQFLELNDDLKNSGTDQINFFKQNVSVTVTTSDGTYIVTIKDWAKYIATYNVYKNDPTTYNNNWLIVQGSGASAKPKGFALLTTLGDAVDLHYAEAATNNFKPLKLNSVGDVVAGNPCGGLIGPVE